MIDCDQSCMAVVSLLRGKTNVIFGPQLTTRNWTPTVKQDRRGTTVLAPATTSDWQDVSQTHGSQKTQHTAACVLVPPKAADGSFHLPTMAPPETTASGDHLCAERWPGVTGFLQFSRQGLLPFYPCSASSLSTPLRKHGSPGPRFTTHPQEGQV